MNITILTPTYNRAYTLPGLYKSLKNQTRKQFEWIIIDDGSNDNTYQLVDNWKNEANFKITYFKTENNGKHQAINKGVLLANYAYTFIVDSDDYLTNDAVEKISDWLATINNSNRFAGVAGLKAYPNGKIVGGKSKFDNNYYIDAKNSERLKYKLIGDKAEVYRTNILKKYPFPTFKNENFLSEDAVWNQISKDGYKLRWFNDVIYICEYLNDGLSQNNNKYIENFKGYTFTSKLKIDVSDFPYNLFYIGQYVSVSRRKNLSYQKIAKLIKQNIFNIILGYLIFKLYISIRKKRKF